MKGFVLVLLALGLVIWSCKENYTSDYKFGGLWPENMYTTMRHISPTFYNGSGLSFAQRPGMYHFPYPRNRWLRNPNDYYGLTNLDDYTHDAANYQR